jgi:hypothetical protein
LFTDDYVAGGASTEHLRVIKERAQSRADRQHGNMA